MTGRRTCLCKPIAPLPLPVMRQGSYARALADHLEAIRSEAEAWINGLISKAP